MKVDHSKNSINRPNSGVSTQSESSKQRRVQSAKARLINSESCKNKPPRILERRHSAKVKWDDSSDSKPTGHSGTLIQQLDVSNHSENESLEPCVYGYKTKRRICRSEADISKLGKPLKSCLKSSSQNLSSSQTNVTSRGEEDLLTDEALGVFADDEDTEEETEEEGDEKPEDVGL